MLSANATPMPSRKVPQPGGNSFLRPVAFLIASIRAVAGRKRRRIPFLPDELRKDVGLPDEDRVDRMGAFWRQKLSSDGRDLPL